MRGEQAPCRRRAARARARQRPLLADRRTRRARRAAPLAAARRRDRRPGAAGARAGEARRGGASTPRSPPRSPRSLPRRSGRQRSRAIVALELLFDYLDGRTEGIAEDPIGQGERLFAPFIDAVMRGHATGADAGQPADWGYLTALSERTRDGLFALSAADAVGEVGRRLRAALRAGADAHPRRRHAR